ncbi:hypothetical protein [Sphingomonas cavernae]|nr:hypothetical protein [Sphingomonas cavernae]
MQLRTGAWEANIDGVEATLSIVSVDPAGIVTGQLVNYSDPTIVINGLWDDTAQRLTFLTNATAAGGGGSPSREFFEAYLISTPQRPAPGQDIVWTLAGSVQSIGHGSLGTHLSNARRSRFGWFAQISEVS